MVFTEVLPSRKEWAEKNVKEHKTQILTGIKFKIQEHRCCLKKKRVINRRLRLGSFTELALEIQNAHCAVRSIVGENMKKKVSKLNIMINLRVTIV